MKFCLSSRQTPEYLAKADEIRIASRDVESLFDLLEQYPDKTFVYNLENLKYAEPHLKKLVLLNQNRITLALYNLEDREYCIANFFPYYYIRPVNTFSQARALKDLGVSQILIDAPLTHMFHKVKLLNIPIRVIPVFSFLDNLPRDNGVNGNWIRPEELEYYEPYIDTIEFGLQPQKREQALFRIYAEQHEWAGELGRIIHDLNYIGTNRMLNPEYTIKRMNCGMICAENPNNCHICYNLLDLATEKTVIQIQQEKDKNNNDNDNY